MAGEVAPTRRLHRAPKRQCVAVLTEPPVHSPYSLPIDPVPSEAYEEGVGWIVELARNEFELIPVSFDGLKGALEQEGDGRGVVFFADVRQYCHANNFSRFAFHKIVD